MFFFDIHPCHFATADRKRSSSPIMHTQGPARFDQKLLIMGIVQLLLDPWGNYEIVVMILSITVILTFPC